MGAEQCQGPRQPVRTEKVGALSAPFSFLPSPHARSQEAELARRQVSSQGPGGGLL